LGFPETFKALSDPVRREILVMLRAGKLSAGEIAGAFEISGATISYHLSQLKKAGLITESKYKNLFIRTERFLFLMRIMLWFSQFGGKENEK
jgi:DNA-binding transcriptional ArsR family regulator